MILSINPKDLWQILYQGNIKMLDNDEQECYN